MAIARASSLVAFTALAACARTTFPGDQEETYVDTADVPAQVRVAGEHICGRIGGGAVVEEWFWDSEDRDWEARIGGMDRRAELDVTSEGAFSELELVYDFAEVELMLPDVAERIRGFCHADEDVFIELSLRRETFLDAIPELDEAWSQSGVVLECQCPGGRDFELDARRLYVTRPQDDRTDVSR